MKVVKTVSGSSYLINEESKEFLRNRGENEKTFIAENDGQWVKFDDITNMEVGKVMEIWWTREGANSPTIRMTTPVSSIEEE